MGRPGPQTHAKRLREQAKREKRRAKDARRAARKAAKEAEKSPATPVESSTEPSAIEENQPSDESAMGS